MESFAVVIPAYNEAATIRALVERTLEQQLPVIVVDDGSEDETSEQLRDLPITLLKNTPNAGKAAALWKGFEAALKQDVDGIITLDGDGQHRPEDIPRFIEACREHPEKIIIGSRLHDREKIPPRRYYANRFANFWIAWASGMPLLDSQSGFRLYPAGLLSSIDLDTRPESGFVFESEVIIEAGWRGVGVHNIPIPALYDEAMRASHFRSVLDITRITRMVAKRLVSRGLYLPGLYNALFRQPS